MERPEPRAARAAGGATVHLCAFRVGLEDYAVDVMRVREILRPLPVAPAPRAPALVEGVFRLRGEAIPLVDLRKRLGVEAGPPTRDTRFLVVDVGRRRVGLLVDQVCEVLRVARHELLPAPALPQDGEGGPRLFLGACGAEGPGARRRRGGAPRVRLLLDVKALLGPGAAPASRPPADAARRA